MTYWSSPNAEPKRDFRWVLGFGDGLTRIDAYMCKNAERPTFSQEEAEVAFLNHTFYYPGRLKWKELALTLYDKIDPNGANRVYQMIRNAGYHLPENPDDYATVSKSAAVASLGALVLTQINAAGHPIEIWTLKNAWIKDFTPSKWDYTSNEVATLDITIRFDFAKLEQMPASPEFQNFEPELP